LWTSKYISCPKCEEDRGMELWHPIELCPQREMRGKGTLPWVDIEDLKEKSIAHIMTKSRIINRLYLYWHIGNAATNKQKHLL
jgi:hypothetical protein